MTQLLQNALYGTVMILAVVVLRQVLRDRLHPTARLALWGVCLFRLLTPAAPASVLSLWRLTRLFEPPQQAAPVPTSHPAAGFTPAAGASAAPAVQPQPGIEPGISWDMVLLAVWLIVGAVLAVKYAVSWRRTRRAVECAIPLNRDDPRYVSLPGCARLREGPIEGAPLTFGVVRPVVVLSPGLEGAELDCVLAHEGVHAARRDNLWHYVMALALVVHWWNPVVWLMSRLLRRDVELSCDRAALSRLGGDRRADYASALVSLATQTEGPDFCQTFGRKAAEERILSIMKFKKTSVIGVIFTLALVLAVTVAFASDPKEPDGTVEYHGQTYSRAGLSQETLDWLDWYLALPEEEQLAVSMVPPELISGLAADVQDIDVYDSEKTASTGVCMSFDDGVLTRFTCDISALEEDLNIEVSKGTWTAAEAARILALAKLIAPDGTLDWTFKGPSGLTHEKLGVNRTAVCYRDQDGNLVPVGPSGIVASFILPEAFEGNPPAYIEEDEEVGTTARKIVSIPDIEATKDIQSDYPEVAPDDVNLDMLKERLAQRVADGELSQKQADFELTRTQELLEAARRGEAKLFLYDTGEIIGSSVNRMYYQDEDGNLIPMGSGSGDNSYVSDSIPGYVHDSVRDYDVKLPEIDEDGNPVNSGVIGAKLYSYSIVTDTDAVVGSEAVPRYYDENGTHELCTEDDCGVVGMHYHDEQHHDVIHMVDLPTAPVNGEDLYPRNSKGETYGPCYPNVDYLPDLQSAIGTNGEEGYVRDCDMPGANVRNPDEALEYMEWMKTQPPEILIPLYDSEGNVIGQFSVSNTQSTLAAGTYHVCNVSGCTLEGLHDHNGVTYCGGADHHNSTCDGSCYYCAQQFATAQTSTSSTHHSSNHHGSSHH